jgi:hypothetical protein
MTLKVSLDGGATWSTCTPDLIDFEHYPALLLRFIEGGEEELPPWISPCLQRRLDARSIIGNNPVEL